MESLKSFTKTIRASNVSNSGSSDFLSDPIDTAGFGGIRAIVSQTAVEADATLIAKIQGCTSSGGSYKTYSSGHWASYTTTGAAGTVVAEIWQPKYRWAKVLADRGTTDTQTLAPIIVELYAPAVAPSTSTTLRAYGFDVSPST